MTEGQQPELVSSTVVVQIGNTDNKLTQQRWSEFVRCVDSHLPVNTSATHFRGFAPADEPWQNACWVVEVPQERLDPLRQSLSDLAHAYHQDSIAMTVGASTEFVGPDWRPHA